MAFIVNRTLATTDWMTNETIAEFIVNGTSFK